MQKHKLLPVLLILSALIISACSIPGGNNIMMDSPSEGISNPDLTIETDTNTEDSQAIADPAESVMDESMQADTTSVCYHPYFPISEGAAWTFKEANGEEYILSVDQTSSDTFTLTQKFINSELTLEMDWYCSEDGLLNGTFAQADLFGQISGTDDPDFQLEALEWEGSTLPPVELLAVGYSWIASYEMVGEMNIEGITSTTEVHVKLDNTISAIEEVTIPAGYFPEALRVDSVGEIELILVMGETATPLNGVQFTYSTWYVEGLGMVKSSNEFSGMQSDIELVSSSLLP